MRPMCIGRSMYFEPCSSAASEERTDVRDTDVTTATRGCRKNDQHAADDDARLLCRRMAERGGQDLNFKHSITIRTAPASTDMPSIPSLGHPAGLQRRSSFSIFMARPRRVPGVRRPVARLHST